MRFGRFAHPAYGILAAVALGAIIVLVLGITTVRTIDTSPTAQSEPIYPQTTAQTSGQPSTPESAARTANASPGPTQPARPTEAPRTQPARPTQSSTLGVRPSGGPARASTDATPWVRTLQELDAQRAKAFWALDMDALDNIYVRGSSPWAADRALLAEYRNQNVRVRGLQITIENTTISRRTPTTITLRTTDHLTGGEVVDQSGTSSPLPPGRPTSRLITLTTNLASTSSSPSGTWRISTITQA